MTEQELRAKIEEIQSEHFSRMNRDLAPYLDQLRSLQAGWSNHKPGAGAGMRAMTRQELAEFYHEHGKYPGGEEKPTMGSMFSRMFGFYP